MFKSKVTKFLSVALIAVGVTVGLAGCDSDAKVASRNLSEAADNFEINRRIVFYNGITDTYMLVVEGFCSVEHLGNRIGVTCKIGPNEIYKHWLGLSDNISYFVEQIDAADVSTYHYHVRFKPQSVIPDLELKTKLR